jgi:cell division protein FtsB
MPPTIAQLSKRMDKLEREVKQLREERVAPDRILTDEDRQAIAAAEDDARNGRLVSHAALKQKYGL